MNGLTDFLIEIIRFLFGLITGNLSELKEGQRKIMATLDDLKAENAKTQAALENIAGDIQRLSDQIANLPPAGVLTQAQLDEAVASAKVIADRAASIAGITPEP